MSSKKFTLAKSNFEELLARIMDLKRLTSEAQVAKLFGMGASGLSSWKARGAIPASKLENFALKEGVTIEWLLTGKGEIFDLRASAICPPSNVNVLLLNEWKDKPHISIESYISVPLVDGRIAAGPGRAVSEGDIKSFVWIYAPALKNRIRHHITAIEIEKGEAGESMKPTLEPGDIVLIDHDDPGAMSSADEIRDGKIYAIRTGPMDAGCAVKRLHKINGGILIISDNSKNNPPKTSWTTDHRELIIGRVVWGWRNLLRA
jgi:phage repressor protein C with HTH and peptisase S24 domain